MGGRSKRVVGLMVRVARYLKEKKMKYLLSVVIPTQNRQKYCALSVKQIYDSTDERVQIIVQDNSSDDALKAMLEAGEYSERVKYYYLDKRIRCAENYNIAIGHADGEYICCIGDDDGVLPQTVDVVEFAKSYDIDAIRPNTGAIYLWPSVSNNTQGKLALNRHDTTFRFADPKIDLEQLLSEGCQNYLSMDLVKAYHGVVRRTCFDEVYKKTGHYCGALSSDIFMCVALSLVVNKVLIIDHPLTISGACKQSTSGDAINKCNFGKLESAPHFAGQEYAWSDKVPAFYSSPAIWADSALRAFIEMGHEEMLRLYNLEKLTAICLHKFPQFKETIYENFNRNNGRKAVMKKYLWEIRRCEAVLKTKKGLYPLYKKIRAALHLSVEPEKPHFEACDDIIKAEAALRPVINESIQQLLLNLSSGMSQER